MMLRKDDIAISAAISFRGAHDEPCPGLDRVPGVLELRMDDVPSVPTDPVELAQYRLRQRAIDRQGRRVIPPSEAIANELIVFIRSLDPAEGTVLCQCFAGVSRSPAAALVLLAHWAGPGRESEAPEVVRAVRPAAQPHRDLVRFADKAMGRDGPLIRALG
ncbi:MAG: hypothetical protein AAGI53_05190 [Planctomycetota bacterium]